MPGKLSENKQRISYAEFKVKIEALKKIAIDKGVSMSEIMRIATDLYLRSETK